MRLTTSIRRTIVDAIIAHRYEAEHNAAVLAEKQAGDELYCCLYSREERDLMDRAPNGAFTESAALYFERPNDSWLVPFTKARSVFAMHQFRASLKDDSVATATAIAEFQNARRKASAIEDEMRVMRREIEGVVNSVNTTKRLIEVWPEVEAFVPKDEKGGALSIVPTRLNHALELPPGAQEHV